MLLGPSCPSSGRASIGGQLHTFRSPCPLPKENILLSLAIYASIKHFRHFVEGRPFTVFTDPKPLTYALASSTDRSPRQANHLSYISEFTSDIQHVRGTENVVADALSRPLSAASCELPRVDFAAFAPDPKNADQTSLEVTPVTWQGVRLLCDISTGSPRPLVPASFTCQIFAAFHSLSHAGARPTPRLVAEHFIWPGLCKDVREWCRQCHPCQASKVARHIKAPTTVMPPSERRFGDIHLDLVGPLPPSEDHRYLLTMVDRFSCWPKAIPFKEVSAAACATAFI